MYRRLSESLQSSALIGRGVDVSDVFHLAGTKGRVPGPDPEGDAALHMERARGRTKE
jgi:hypothetical protein